MNAAADDAPPVAVLIEEVGLPDATILAVLIVAQFATAALC